MSEHQPEMPQIPFERLADIYENDRTWKLRLSEAIALIRILRRCRN